ncbi:MAG: hypothetical protein NC392_00100 [Roseburia sp.]|nr:hypothetical protein [Roseburia sp.]
MTANTSPDNPKKQVLSRNVLLYKGVYYIMCLLFLSIVLQKGYTIIAYGTPKELREMNTVAFAFRFAYGQNPYAASLLQNTIPAPTSMYGFLVPLLLASFIRLLSFTGLNALQICELITLIVEIIGALFFYRLLYGKTGRRIISIMGMLFFYSCYWRYSGFAGAFPDQWGLTLSILLADVLYHDKKRQLYRPALYAGIIVALFYIKQYFVLTAIGVCVYLFICSKKDYGKFLAYGTLAGILSIALVHHIFPLYFSEVFPIGQGQVLMGDPGYSLKQLIKLTLDYGGIIIFGLLHVFICIRAMIRQKELKKEFSYEFCQLVFLLPIVFYIAENQGTNYTYYLQLWYPYVILCCMGSLPVITEYIQNIFSRNIRTLCLSVQCILITITFIRILPFFQCPFMTKDEKAAWDRSYQILAEYAPQGDMLVTMLLSDYCLENDIATSNYGQAEYNTADNLQKYKDNKIWRNLPLVEHTEAILQNNISYNAHVRDNIARQAYRCIAITYTWEYQISEEELAAAGYRVLTTETLYAGRQCWNVTFYVPE